MNIYQLRSLLTKAGAKHFAKRIYYYSKRIARKSINIITNKKPDENLVFIFGGRIDSWPTTGRNLYKTTPDFRNTINLCNTILVNMGGAEILSYFEKPVDPQYFEDEAKFTCITAIQIATAKLYNDSGIFPNAVMGVSLGEAAAGYAAGALTVEEAIKIALGYITIYKYEEKDYSFILLNLPLAEAIAFCYSSPVWTEVIYESTPQSVLITCHKNNLSDLETFFKQKSEVYRLISDKISFAYHTSRMIKHLKMLKQFQLDIVHKPLKCDLYSPTLGIKIPKNTILDAAYWCSVPTVPVLFNSALQAFLNDGYTHVIQVGPPAISGKQFHNATSTKLNIINTYPDGPEELQYHLDTQKSIRKKNYHYSSVSADEAKNFEDYKQQLNLYQTASTEIFKYLRTFGKIHYLPQHNAWLFLGYDDIENALKQPQIFSSSILKSYDPILLGADPEVHQIIRALLQPLFSPAIIAELADFASAIANQLLTDLTKKPEFDFVKDYSDPITLLSLCNFFGLSDDDAATMLGYTGKDYHGMEYWQKLEEFFVNNFETITLTKKDSLWGKLRELVENQQFSKTDASSLLKIIWTAGMATTSALISVAVIYSLNNPELSTQISTDEKLISKFIEECLRVQTSITSVHRITTINVEMEGQVIPANSMVMLNLKSAMADPLHYNEPYAFSISRPAKKHLAFGTGIHQCIGMGIARAEARSALKVTLKYIEHLNQYKHSEPIYSKGSDLETMISLKMTRLDKQNLYTL